MEYGKIYKITNMINNKIYIGQTVNCLKRRYSGGLKNIKHNSHLRSSINKYGIENFKTEIIAYAYSKEELDNLECYYIEKFNSTDNKFGYNKKTGGANGRPSEETRVKLRLSHLGHKFSEETRKKMSEVKKGEKCHMYGKPKSNEVRRKISESLKGRFAGENNPRYGKVLSEETKLKISKAKTGWKMSEEQRKRMSMAKKGVKFTEEHKINISKGRKGITFTEEHKQKLSQAKKGKQLSEEHRRKISDSNKGRKQSRESVELRRKKCNKKIRCITTNMVFESLTEASLYYNINKSVISNCCNKKQKTTKLKDGTRVEWEFFEDNQHMVTPR